MREHLTDNEKLLLIRELLEDYQTGRISFNGFLIALAMILRMDRMATDDDIRWAEKND